ncbi:MAG: OadG family protein [Clostridia bacterium]|nr:OadG family protein [Clostridia bacterium]
MNNFVFALAKMNFSERAGEAGIVTLQGMVMVFAVLAILWAAVEIMHAIVHRGEKTEKAPREKKGKKSAAEKAEAPTGDAMIAAAIAAALAASEDDGATVAAITAAISAMRAEEGCTGGFRVVSFKRVPQGRRR